MKPEDFTEANAILKCSEEQKIQGCQDLKVFSNGELVVSKWVLADEEIELIRLTKQVWFISWSPTHPPISMQVEKPTFYEQS